MNPSHDKALLTAVPMEVYKTDRRSTVWRVQTPRGPMVVKRFEYSPPRQCAAWLLGVHPAQREVRANRRLLRDGFPVVEIAGCFMVRAGLGGKVHLVTPHWGESLQRLLRSGGLKEADPRRRVLEAVGELAGRLIRRGWRFRDLKSSNIVLDDEGTPHLIDVGSTRRSGGAKKAEEMLAMLRSTLAGDGIGEAEQAWWEAAATRGGESW